MQDQQDAAYQKALRYISRQAYTCRQVADYLERKGFDGHTAESVVEKLVYLGLLNDLDYAWRYVQDRRAKFQSKQRMAYALHQKGISKADAEAALAQVTEAEELANAVRAAEQYAARSPADPRLRSKLGQVLARQGFGWDIIQRAMGQLFTENTEDGPLHFE